MMNTKTIMFATGLTLTSAMFAFGAQDIECRAHGKSVSVKGGGLVEGDATLTFTETRNRVGQRLLKNIEGTVTTADTLGDVEDPYVGHFNKKALVENPDYNPHKYVGYSQFLNFDAAETTGRESGMWGQFVLEKNTRKAHFSAHYIFKAGDHMGGTLHLSCKVK